MTGWSRKSRARLIAAVSTLDLLPLVTGAHPPGMVTLTLPGDWLAVCPSAAAAAAMFHRWTRAYERRWGLPLACIWKREFQRRGAPHWHLWLVPPGGSGDLAQFRTWLSESWTRAVFGGGGDPAERARHLGAGTRFDVSKGLQASDPRRLAVYFLKESLGGEGKAYQNLPPAEWDGEPVGRYWGVRGIPKALERVELDPVQAHRLWRAMRKSAEARRAPIRVQVPRGVTAAGVVRFRWVTRRRRVTGPAGWVAVNDGAAFASQLARYLDLLDAPELGPALRASGLGESSYDRRRVPGAVPVLPRAGG